MRVQSYKAGVYADAGIDLPDKDYHNHIRHEYGYELVYQWGVESLRVSLYQYQNHDKTTPIGTQVIILHLGHESSAVACDSVFDTMQYAEGPLRFVHTHLLIYGILFPVSAHPPPGSQI